jgi:hypothetical protein
VLKHLPRAAKLGKLKELIQAFEDNLVHRSWETFRDLQAFLRSSGYVSEDLNAKLNEVALAEIQWKALYREDQVNTQPPPPGLWTLLA